MNFMDMLTDPTFWVAIGLLIFAVIVYKPATQAITGGLDARAARIEEELARALRLREEAEALLATYQSQYEEAIQASEAMVKKAQVDAEAYAASMQAELQSSMEKRRAMAEQKIAQAETRAIQEVRQHVADIAISTARELITQRIASGQGDDILRIATSELQRKLH